MLFVSNTISVFALCWEIEMDEAMWYYILLIIFCYNRTIDEPFECELEISLYAYWLWTRDESMSLLWTRDEYVPIDCEL